MNNNDWLGILSIILLLISAVLISYYLISHTISKCVDDPLKYAIDEIADGENYSYAVLYIYRNKLDLVPISKREIDLTKKILLEKNLTFFNQSV